MEIGQGRAESDEIENECPESVRSQASHDVASELDDSELRERAQRKIAAMRSRAQRQEMAAEPKALGPCRGVYFALSVETNRVKIGKSYDVHKRVGDLATMNAGQLMLLAYVDGYTHVEKFLHRKFRHLRTHGEWFELQEDLSKLIERAERNSALSEEICADELAADMDEARETRKRITTVAKRERYVAPRRARRPLRDQDEVLQIWAANGGAVPEISQIEYVDLGLYAQHKLESGYLSRGEWTGCYTATWAERKTLRPRFYEYTGLLPVASHIASFDNDRDRTLALIAAANRDETDRKLYGEHHDCLWKVIDEKYRPNLYGSCRHTLPADYCHCAKCRPWYEIAAESEQDHVARLAHLVKLEDVTIARVLREPDERGRAKRER